MSRLMLVVPCYNEEECLPETVDKLTECLCSLINKGKIDPDSGMLLVNDGSRDSTWELIKSFFETNQYVYGVNLAANSGHQNALMAGIETAAQICDFSVSIDADLQDDIGVIEEMVDKYIGGADIVYGVRGDRSTDSGFKRFTAESFYKFLKLMGVKTVYNHADFRLMSKRAMEDLCQYKEQNLYLRGIIPLIGYKTDSVYYSRKERTAGESKYPLKKMISLAWNGITSFSVKPILFITWVGALMSALSFGALIVVTVLALCGFCFTTADFLLVSVWLVGGLLMLSLGIVGQYVGKILTETKNRPRYRISEFLNRN
ncbi:MAG: glycosyltransferase family 2 protein [Clostridia bacterium]|nr:glycosyltransferase family 2 protein [Clostridia bacterium]